MKRIIVVALVTIAAASVAAGQCGRTGKMVRANPVVTAIKRLETERNKALVAGDVAAIGRLYADDYSSVVASTSRNKAEVLADLKSGALKLDASDNDETNVRVYGNTAVVTGKTTSKVHDRGADTSGQSYFTRVYVNQMGRWRLVANHSSRVTP
jgi:hypothetical protein